MKNLKILTLLFLLIVPTILAESISQTSFTVKVYNNTIEIISEEYTGNNQVFNFDISSKNDTISSGNSTVNVSTYYVPYKENNYTFLFVRNISVDMSLVEKWSNCMNETNTCKLDAAANYTQFVLEKTNKDNDITNKQNELNKLQKDKTDTQNQKWLFGVGGAVLAVFITLMAQGKILNKIKDRTKQFNRGQAG